MLQTIDQTVTETQPTTPTLKPKSQEVFRTLWASLFYSGRVSQQAVLMCSAARQEGTSTIATALALAGSMPSGSATVALVDFNLRAPMIHELLKLDSAPGVCEIITEHRDPASVVKKVSSGLDVYVAGHESSLRSLDILKDQGVSRFFSGLREAYDHIIVDVAATNHFPDAQMLAAVIPDIVLVARAEQTPREAVAQAKKRLESGGATVVGIVMNLRTYPIPRFLYNRV